MAKRKEILKAIKAHAKANDLDLTITEGGSHTKVTLGDRRTVIGRHTEINELTTRAIYKQLGMNR